jgi:hypothetical protein
MKREGQDSQRMQASLERLLTWPQRDEAGT